MASMRHQGELATWKDDRGFGFIKPSEGGKDVFLHISAIKGSSRRPLVGDTVLYELVVEPDGKMRASNASIRGVTSNSPANSSPPNRHQPATQLSRSHRPSRRQPQTNRRKAQPLDVLSTVLTGVFVVAGLSVIALTTKQSQLTTGQSETNSVPIPVPNAINPTCVIKGNISVETNNRIYHVPGMEDYDITEIDLLRGEQWFCTEDEAISSGWRKAPR